MRARNAFPFLAACAAAATVACVSLKHTPEARFFVLRSLAEPPQGPVADAGSGLVGVLPARLPGHLERPQIVTWAGPGELRIDEFLRWGEPLDAGLTRTLAENLALLLPAHRVVLSPWRSGAGLRCRVVAELALFGLQQDGEVRLEGRWTVLPAQGERPLASGRSSLKRGPLPTTSPSIDAAAGVEAMSELVAAFASEIAAAVRALPEEPSADAGG